MNSYNDNGREKTEPACSYCRGGCDYERYIGKYFKPEDYNKYFHIPDDKQTKIAQNLFKQLEIGKRNNNTEIRIFTAGVGPGRIEIPFLRECHRNGVDLELTAVDLDPGMLTEFYENIQNVFNGSIEITKCITTSDSYSKKEVVHHFDLTINGKIRVEAFCGNLENLAKKAYRKDNYYDYIFGIFVLHAITNWEEPLYQLLRMLRIKGKIVFAEEIGDVNWLDNHFDDIEKYGDCTEETIRKDLLGSHYEKYIVDLHRKFWREYHRARREGLGKEWTKDTKASDLGVIKICFRRMQDLKLVEDCASLNEEMLCARWKSEDPFTFDLLLKWVSGKSQLYTPLSYGLASPRNRNKDDVEALRKGIVEDEGWKQWKEKQLHNFHEKLFDEKIDEKIDKKIGDQDALGIYMEWWLKKKWEELLEKNSNLPQNFEGLKKLPIQRIEGHRFYIYTKKYETNKSNFYNDNTAHKILYRNTVNLHRLRERIAYDSHHIPGNYGGIPPNELTHRLFTLKDVYYRLFPFTHSICTKWRLIDASDLSKGELETSNMPILLTFQELYNNYKQKGYKDSEDSELLAPLMRYLATYLLYFHLIFEKKDDFSFTTFVFRDMPEKFPIIIKKDEHIPYIHFSQVSSGSVKLLELSVPKEMIDKLYEEFNFKFTDNNKELNQNLEGCVTYILDSQQKYLKKFLNETRSYKFCDDNSIEYQDFLLFQKEKFDDLTKQITKENLQFSPKNRKNFDKIFQQYFKGYTKKIEQRFADIEQYNDWHIDNSSGKQSPKEFLNEFVKNAVRAAIIGHKTDCEWDIFSKYPGKCFKSGKDGAAREEGIGGFIVMRKKFHDNKKLEEIFQKNHKGTLFLISGLWARNDAIFEWGRLTRQEMIRHGTKAAVAAIMARNMSHIHGSHIEPGLQNNMKTFEKVMCDRIFEND